MPKGLIRVLAMSALSLLQAHSNLEPLNSLNCLHLPPSPTFVKKTKKIEMLVFEEGMGKDEMSSRTETRVS